MASSSRVVGSLARLSISVQARSNVPLSSPSRCVLSVVNGPNKNDGPSSTYASVQCRRSSSTRTNRLTRDAEKVSIHHEDKDDDNEDDNDDDDESSNQPWKTLLMAPARAAWRVAEPQLPPALDETVQRILKNGNRTPNQLKRAHRKVLEIHTTLAELRERERRRLVNGKYYRGKDAGDENSLLPVIYGYDETLGTLKHRLYPNYVITKRVLRECQSLLDIKPQRIVDFGIGCGSASAAALNVFGENIDWIHGIDPSQPMRECSRCLLEGLVEQDARERVPQITFSTGISTEPSSSTTTSQGSFDLALFAYTATDLPDITSTLAAAAMLFQKLKPNGIFVMIEPGTPDGFNSIRAVRNMLLDCCPPDDPDFPGEERCRIIAPCTHNGECPMVRHKKDFVKKKKFAHDLPQDQNDSDTEDSSTDDDDDDVDDDSFNHGEDFVEMLSNSANLSEFDAFNSSFCSFVQTMPGSKRKKGEKFSYLVAQKKIYGQEEQGNNSFGKEDDLAKLLARAHAAVVEQDANAVQQIFQRVQDLESRYIESDEDILGLELVKGDAKRESMGRIVRAPIKKKGHVYIDYCTAPGRIIRNRIAKSSTHVAPGMWNAARKSRWGGLWPDTMDKIYFQNK